MGAEPQIVPEREPVRRHHDRARAHDPADRVHRDSPPKQAPTPGGPLPPLAHPALAHPANRAVRAEAAHRVQQQSGNRAAQHAIAHAPAVAHAAPAHTEAPGAAEPLLAVSADRMTDGQAQAALLGEWLSDTATFAVDPVRALFDAPRSLDLRIPAQPASSRRPPTGADPKAAIDEAQAGYDRFLSTAGRQHDDVMEEANRALRSLDAAAEESLRQVDTSLIAPLAVEMASLAANRRQLDESLSKARTSIDTQAAAARRQIAGTAFAARHRIDQAAAAAAARLPGFRADLTQRFVTLYDEQAKRAVDSGTATSTTLKSAEKKAQVAASLTSEQRPDLLAMLEAKRAAVPANLDTLAESRTINAAAFGRQIQARFAQAGVVGGHSVGQTIDAFIESIRIGIEGGDAAGQHVESLRDAGHKAVDRAESQTLTALHDQVKAAQEALRSARTNGDAQIVAQRSAAFARLNQVRSAATGGIRDARSRAAQSLSTAGKTALATYGDSARRLAQTLEQAAGHGPAALSETARQAFLNVAKTLADGQKTQTQRLSEVGDGASASVRQMAAAVPMQAADAAAELDRALAGQTGTLVAQVTDTVQQQTKSMAGMASGVAAAADNYIGGHARACRQAVEKEKTNLDPVHTAEEANCRKAVDDLEAEDKKKVADPAPDFAAELKRAGDDINKQCDGWAAAVKGAFGILMTDEEAILNALRGHTRAQEASIEYKFADLGGGNLRSRLKWDNDQPIGGLSDKQYDACIAYLNGDTLAGAKLELATTVHWYGGEGDHAENVMRSLTVEQQQDVGRDAVAARVKDHLSGTDLKVFDALAQGKDARADAYRVIDKMDAARREGDTEAQIKALRQYTGGATPQAAQEHLAEVQREFADIKGIVDAQTGKPVTQEVATREFVKYAVEDKQVEVPDENGGIDTVTMKLNKADAILIGNAAQYGVDSAQGKAARILHEAVREDEKPNQEELENAAVDPRLNPALNPALTPAQKTRLEAERDAIFKTAADMGQQFGFAQVPDAKAAKDLLAERLGHRYDLTDEKGRVGATYVQSIVQKDVPDAAAGLRYAMLGWGTDEDLIHRNLQRLSRKDVERVRGEYARAYPGSDLFADLGVYGQGSFGELSGDDRLKAEVELMGVPQNDKERAEVARYRQMQQRNETGAVGAWLNEGSGEDLALSRSEQRLQGLIGGKITTDEFGRPVIATNKDDPASHFDAAGNYTGPDKDAFTVEVDFAQAAAENYAASIDRITNAITTTIAVVAAAVAIVVTGGAAAPILAAAIAGASSMLASYAIKGGRYGWEQAATDLAMTGVQMLTAGVGEMLGAAAKAGTVAAETAEVAETAGTAAAKTESAIENAGKSRVAGALEKVAAENGPTYGRVVRIGAVTGGIGSAGTTALDEHTWDKGVGAGLGRVFLSGARGTVSGAVSAAITGGIERIPVGKTTVGAVLNSTVGPALAGGLLASAGGMGGRAAEIGFDSATGSYHGNLHDALTSVAEGGAQPFFQGLFEGAVRKPHGPPGQDTHERQQAAAGAAEHQPAPPAAAHPAIEDPQRVAAPQHPPEAVPVVPRVPTGEPRIAAPEHPPEALPEPAKPAPVEHPPVPQEPAATPVHPPEAAPEPAKVAPVEHPSMPQAPVTVEPAPVPQAAGIDPDHARIAANGTPFDARFSTLPDGSRFDVRPFRRGPAGEWIEAATGHPVTDPTHLAALEAWNRNMAGSRVAPPPEAPRKLVPAAPAETPPPAPAPPRPTEPIPAVEPEHAAGGVPGAKFHGGAVPLTAEGEQRPGAANRNSVVRALDRLLSPEGPFHRAATERPDQPLPEVELTAHNGEKVKVRIETGVALEPTADEALPSAEYVRDGDGYKIRISQGARSSDVERALAHEFAEIRAVHPSAGSASEHALEPGAKTTELSGHDQGRLAEVRVLARQFNEAPPDSPKRAALRDEAERLANHLGLTGDGAQPTARLGRALEALGEGPASAFLKDAAGSAKTNPFLERLYGDPVHDLRVLARRLERASTLAESPGELAKIAEQIHESARQLLWKNELLYAKRDQPPVRDRVRLDELKPWLSPSEQKLLDTAVESAASRRKPAGAEAGASSKPTEPDPAARDPHTAEAVRAAFADEPNFQDWPKMRDKYLAGIPPDQIEPQRLRWLFDEWAAGKFIGEKGAPRSLFTEDLGPSKGFAAKFKIENETRPGLQLEATDPVTVDGRETTVAKADALRQQKLNAAEPIREALEKARAAEAPEPVIQALRDQLTSNMRPVIGISEALGVAAGRAFLIEHFGGVLTAAGLTPESGFVEIPRAGSGVPDLVYKLPNGQFVVVECKGGESGLGTRLSTDKTYRVEQGHLEYLKSLAYNMANSSTDPAIRKLGGELLLAATKGPLPEYWKVQQPFDEKTGRAAAPIVSQFDLGQIPKQETATETTPASGEQTATEGEPEE